jgi:hypothetical protein
MTSPEMYVVANIRQPGWIGNPGDSPRFYAVAAY